MARINTPESEEQSETIERYFECWFCKKPFKRKINSLNFNERVFEMLKKENEPIINSYTIEFLERNSEFKNLRYCSMECEDLYKKDHEEKEKIRIKEERERRIQTSLPSKFVNIESDMKDIDSLIGKSLFITGRVGVGKSVLMAAVIKQYIRVGKHIRWISYPKFIMRLQGMFRNNEENPYLYAEEIAEFDGILAIDDLGVEKPTDFVRQITYSIINERECNERLLLITSNHSLKEIDITIDERISSRIVGMCEIIKLDGKDRRIK